MKFKYKKYGPGVLRPVIPVEVEFGNLAVPYEVLVDSGADLCIFDSQIASILGINVLKGIKNQVTGVTGFPEDYYVHHLTIKVGGSEHKIDVGFMPMRNSAYGIVGQKGFFSVFIVKFDLQKEEIEIKLRA